MLNKTVQIKEKNFLGVNISYYSFGFFIGQMMLGFISGDLIYTLASACLSVLSLIFAVVNLNKIKH